jgi:membrane-bound lytic murein transglycosylase B
MFVKCITITAFLLVCGVSEAASIDVPPGFIKKAAIESGYSRSEVGEILKSAELKPWIIETMERPGESLSWPRYRKMVVTDSKIENGKRFIVENWVTLREAEVQYQVPMEVIAAIIGVESGYGANKGRVRVLDALSTLGFSYPRRAKFFQAELIEFLSMSRKEGIDPLQVQGSYAGAMGWPQFMPSSVRKLAIDFDRDGRVDIINSPVDAIGSVANYLSKSGWALGQDPLLDVSEGTVGDLQLENEDGTFSGYRMGQNFKAILKYNRSKMYAAAVYELSEKLKQR